MVAAMTQLPLKDWAILPVSVIAVLALTYTGIWAAKKLGLTNKPRTFAEHEENFWARLRLIVREEMEREDHNRDHRS